MKQATMITKADPAYEGTVVGAIDTYLKELIQGRPFLLQRYTNVLEEMAESWDRESGLREAGTNQLAMIDPKWLGEFIALSADRGLAMNALQDFYRWATQRNLVLDNPLGGFMS